MCFLPLQQDFYSKSHASPQNSSQIYAYAWGVRLTFSFASFVISAENETGTPRDWERLMEEE